MAEPDNIDFFNLFTIAIFDRLYNSFPTPIQVNAVLMASELIPEKTSEEARHKKLQSAGYALSFLAEEGFVTYKDARPNVGQFVGVRLTAKGLAVLNSVPGSIEKSEPLIGRIRKILTGGVKEAGNESIRQIVQSALTTGLAAVPSIVSRAIS